MAGALRGTLSRTSGEWIIHIEAGDDPFLDAAYDDVWAALVRGERAVRDRIAELGRPASDEER